MLKVIKGILVRKETRVLKVIKGKLDRKETKVLRVTRVLKVLKG